MKNVLNAAVVLALVLTSGCKICQLEMNRPTPKPDCPPGYHAEKMTCKACRGTGFLDAPCPGCRATGITYIQKQIGYQIYLEPQKCLDCCGGGNQLHQLCHGKGWTWQCVINQ